MILTHRLLELSWSDILYGMQLDTNNIPVISSSPTTTASIVIFAISPCLYLWFQSFAFVELIYRSEFYGGPEYPGSELCFSALQSRLNWLCFRGQDFRSWLFAFFVFFQSDISPHTALCYGRASRHQPESQQYRLTNSRSGDTQ